MAKRLLRYDEVTLPSGLRIRGVRPTAQELIRRGIWPKDLRVQMFLGGADIAEDDDMEQRRRFVESQHVSIAGYIRAEWDTDNDRWEHVEYLTSEVHDFDPRDLDALEDIILRQRTPAQVTADSLAAAGEIDEEHRLDVAEQEADATVTGWAGFRDDPGSVTPSPDSGDVGDAPVGAASNGGRRAGTRARRGTRHPADEG